MCGIYKKGFTLIELMVVIILIGLITAIVTPNLFILRPGYERTLFIENLNAITAGAWHTSLFVHAPQKIVFDLKTRVISVEAEDSTIKKDHTEPLPTLLQKKQMQLPPSMEVHQFFIDGKNDIGQTGRTVTKVWFYVIPEGLSQAVVLNMSDSSQLNFDGSPKKFALVLNPFTAQFKEYETFQKP